MLNLLNLKHEAQLHRTPFKRIGKTQEYSGLDLSIIDSVCREEWEKIQVQSSKQDYITLATDASYDLLKLNNLPTSLNSIKSNQLLSTWEKMRRIIYGGSSGFVAQGLSVEGLDTNGRNVDINESSNLFHNLGFNSNVVRSNETQRYSDVE